MKKDNISFLHVLLILIYFGRSFLVLFLPEVGFNFRHRKQLASARINRRLENGGKCDGDGRQVANPL